MLLLRARDFIFEQFRRRLVHKEYLLLCHGRLSRAYGKIDHPIATRWVGGDNFVCVSRF